MPNDAVAKNSKTYKRDLTSLAIQLKRLMNDIIDVAYAGESEATVIKMKRFSITCTEKIPKTKLGHCQYGSGHSELVIFRMEDAYSENILITTIHETSHHIAKEIYHEEGHGKTFYEVHKRLLFAAFDMGITTPEVISSPNFNSRSKSKLLKLLEQYDPNPVEYKKDVAHITVYNSYNIRDQLRNRGYIWNPLEKAWVLETVSDALVKEQQYLTESLNVSKEDICLIENAAIIIRQRKNVNLYGVQYDQNKIVKELGYHFEMRSKKEKFWTKKISEESLPDDERSLLLNLGIELEIS